MDKSMDVQPERLKNLFKNLVNIYSPTGKEGEILKYAEKYLKNQNLPVSKQEVDENRFNLIVLPERRDEIALLSGNTIRLKRFSSTSCLLTGRF